MSAATAKTKLKKRDKAPTAMAFHGDDGVSHIVGLLNIRVIIVNDGGFWFAQGVDIDYAADGRSLREVKKNFEDGLKATIGHHLQFHNSIEKLLVHTPYEVWSELALKNGKRMQFSQVVHKEVFESPNIQGLPFSGIEYYQPSEEIAA